MKGFWVKTVSLAAIVCVLLLYNAVLKGRKQEESLARLAAQAEALEHYIQTAQQTTPVAQESAEDADADGIYADGQWEGQAQGFGGEISLKVKIENGKIADVTIMSAEKEDPAYLAMAKSMLPAMVKAQSADVDTVTGATFSSEGIKKAAAQALKKAEK